MNNKIRVILLIIFLFLVFLIVSYLYNWRGSDVYFTLNPINKMTITKSGFDDVPYTIVDNDFLKKLQNSLILRPFYNISFIDLNPKDADYKITFYQNSGTKKEIYFWRKNNYIKFNGTNYILYKDTINILNEKIDRLENKLSPALYLNVNGYSDDEKLLIALINLERKKSNLSPYRADIKLTRIARMKSQDMINLNYIGHNSPTFGSYYDMLSAANISFSLVGENIVAANSSEEAFNIMMKDKSQQNLLLSKDFNKLGVGIINGGKHENIFTIILLQE